MYGYTLREQAERCDDCFINPTTDKITVCVKHQECDQCSEGSQQHLCNDHYNEMINANCDECGEEATSHRCDDHAKPECDECGDNADNYLCSYHNRVECDNCGEQANTHYCYSHTPEQQTPECYECSGEASVYYCYTHKPESSSEECDVCSSDAEIRYCESHYDRRIADEKELIKDELRAEIRAEVLAELNGKGTSVTTNNTETLKDIDFRDTNGDRRKMSSSEFNRVANALGYAMINWPESAGARTRNIDIDGYTFRAELVATIARNEFGLRWADEVKSDDSVPAISDTDKSLIERLLQKEQLARFLRLRNAFLSSASSPIDEIPQEVKAALEGYQEITNLMERFGAVPLKNEVMDSMASVSVATDSISLPN